ncbi:MAG: hypothetical protein Q4F65_11905 [Propionibacteriaceae bacterium]|nr:hypothetical protein [Propionibacteriaceae bacterium]
MQAGLAAAASVALVLSVVWIGQIRPLFPAASNGLTLLPGVQAPWVGGVRGNPMGPALLSATCMIDEDDLWWPGPWSTSAYVRDVTGEQVRTVPAADRGPTQPGSIVVSPDGSYIAVGSLARNGRIRVIDTRSGDEREVDLGAGDANTVPLAWSRDGAWFYAYSTIPVPSPGSGLGVGALVAIEASSGAMHTVAGLSGVTQVAPSPSGRELFLASSGNHRIVDASTGRLVRVISREKAIAFDSQPWSPDGRWLIGKRKDQLGSTIIRFDATTPDQVAPHTVLTGTSATGVAWTSPNTYLLTRMATAPDRAQKTYISSLNVQTGALRDVAEWTSGRARLIVTDVSIARDLAPRYFPENG